MISTLSQRLREHLAAVNFTVCGGAQDE